jgi:hypothetical protein
MGGSAAPDEPVDAAPRLVAVPFERVAGWIERYDARHPGSVWTVDAAGVHADSPDGARAAFAPPAPAAPSGVHGDPDHHALLAALLRPRDIGVVLVRRGGFAVAHVVGAEPVEVKVGQRHVQGKTKAGGWSQQRFARRRDNQARESHEAAAGHVHRILVPVAGRLSELVVGGDKAGVQAVLEDRQLATLAALPRRWIGGVADPKRGVLDRAVQQARSVEITVVDPLAR